MQVSVWVRFGFRVWRLGFGFRFRFRVSVRVRVRVRMGYSIRVWVRV